jgi:lipoyl synthase
MISIDELKRATASELETEAFRLRTLHFGMELTFAVPETLSYNDVSTLLEPNRFPAISVTGRECALRCGHCKGALLGSMIPAQTPELLGQTLARLRSIGALGALVSGGADHDGKVPLRPFMSAIRAAKAAAPDFKIICHTGLVPQDLAEEMKDAGVDQVLLDIIGDDETIRTVYHLDKHAEEYGNTLRMLKEVGLRVAPHVIIGHHYGHMRGEWKALEMITAVGVDTIVLVVFKPLFPASAIEVILPEPGHAAKIAAAARILNPETPVRMGCIRPSHRSKAEMERRFIDSGVNTVAYPLQATIEYANGIGLEIKFVGMCCSLIS